MKADNDKKTSQEKSQEKGRLRGQVEGKTTPIRQKAQLMPLWEAALRNKKEGR